MVSDIRVDHANFLQFTQIFASITVSASLWRALFRYTDSSLLEPTINDNAKKFYKIDNLEACNKPFSFVTDILG